jgi:hypothetical protein
MRKLFPLLLLFAFPIRAQIALPTLPQATVNLALPTQGASVCPTYLTGTNCIRNVPIGSDSGASELQNTFNVAGCGDTIVLIAGDTYSGNFTIPQTSCSGWIVVESSAASSLPGPGNRLNPSTYAADLAIISTPNVTQAIQFNDFSNHWRFIGIEITTSYSNASNTLYVIVGMGESDTSAANLPSYIIFDRCYIYGSAVTPIAHGIYADGAYIAVVDSYCDEIIDNGADAQCVVSTNGTGPFLIQNNFMQASGEDIMFGGSPPTITNLNPSDIVVIGNQLQKNTAWQGVLTDVKNIYEFKNTNRALIDGNVLQYTWQSAQDEAMIIRSAGSANVPNTQDPWTVVQNVTVSHNLIQHQPIGTIFGDFVNLNLDYQATNTILYRNNVISDSNSATWGPDGWAIEVSIGHSNQVSPEYMHDVTIDHNTTFSDQAAFYLAISDTSSYMTNLAYTNNLQDCGSLGVSSDSGTAISTKVLGTFTWSKNTLIGSCGDGSSPSGSNFHATNLAAVGFTSYSGTDPDLSGNFQLTSGSAYHNAGTDGKDIGVYDWTCYNATTAAAAAGDYTPASMPSGCNPIAYLSTFVGSSLSTGVKLSSGVSVQ